MKTFLVVLLIAAGVIIYSLVGETKAAIETARQTSQALVSANQALEAKARADEYQARAELVNAQTEKLKVILLFAAVIVSGALALVAFALLIVIIRKDRKQAPQIVYLPYPGSLPMLESGAYPVLWHEEKQGVKYAER